MTYGVTSYRDLQVWRQALDWAETIYLATADWPTHERYGLSGPLRRAAVSAPSNVAKGAARRTTGEFLQFLGMARGSLVEAGTQVLLAQRLGYLSTPLAESLLRSPDEISRMLASLAGALKNTSRR